MGTSVIQLATGSNHEGLSGESMTTLQRATYSFADGAMDAVADFVRRHFAEITENATFVALSDTSLAEDWDSEEDAIYDDL